MTVHGIVVGSTSAGESHKIVRLLTPDRGRISLIARGARASSKRFAGVLDIGTLLDVQVSRGRGGLSVLAQADRLSGPKRARRNLDRIALLAYGCEVCGALAPEEAPAPRLHKLLAVWLDLLEGEAMPGVGSRIALEGKALTFAGITPALLRCGSCGEPLDTPCVYDPNNGGGHHGRCAGGKSVAPNDLALMDRLRRTPLLNTPNTPVPGDTWLLSRTIEEHLGRSFQSKELLLDLARPHG